MAKLRPFWVDGEIVVSGTATPRRASSSSRREWFEVEATDATNARKVALVYMKQWPEALFKVTSFVIHNIQKH